MNAARALLSALAVGGAFAGGGACAVGCGREVDVAPAPTVTTGPTEPSTTTLVQRYLDNASFRRSELVASLVDPSDGYATLRLTSYGRAWETLPIWSPRVAPVTTADLDAASEEVPFTSSAASALSLPAGADAADLDALRALGADAFTRYPVQLLASPETALASAASAASFGLATDPATGRIGGLVHAEMADGSTRIAMTCSTCHAGTRSGAIVPGAPNDAFDLGRLVAALPGSDAAYADAALAWGPGRVDVSSADGTEPARIPDLRPVAHLGFLQQDATVRKLDVVSLAIRLETLIVTSNGDAVRPPRPVAIGLALWVEGLASSLPPLPADGTAGLEVIQRSCSSCHAGDGLTGAPVPLAMVGTDPALGASAERGTGFYRVPSLRGVGTRGPLLHDASAPSLDVFFDPARTSAGFTGGRDGRPVPGHPWNIEIDAGDRAAVLELLRDL